MIARAWAVALVVAAFAALGPRPAAAQAPLVADISAREIAITTGFAGAELLLFGAFEGRGDVVVVVRGPRPPVVVRKKNRVFGIWLNTESRTFIGLPQYYRVAATRPLDQVAPRAVLERYEIGEDHLDFALALHRPEQQQLGPGEAGGDRDQVVGEIGDQRLRGRPAGRAEAGEQQRETEQVAGHRPPATARE